MLQNDDMTVRSAVQIAFLCCLFGANAVAIKFSLTGLGPFTCAGIRFAVAAFVIYLWARYKKIPLALTRKQVKQMVALSALFVAQLSCFYHGLERTTASHGVLISNILPFGVLILAHFFIPGDRITLKKGIGIILGFTGVFLLFFDRQDMAEELKKGDLIILMAVLMWSTNAIFVKRIIFDYHPVQITLYPMIFGTPFFLLGGYLWDGGMIRMVNATVINAMLYQSVVTASFGFIAWNTMLRKFGATSLHSFMFIMPLAGVLAGVILLEETVTPHLAGAVCFIATGVLVVNLKRKKKTISAG